MRLPTTSEGTQRLTLKYGLEDYAIAVLDPEMPLTYPEIANQIKGNPRININHKIGAIAMLDPESPHVDLEGTDQAKGS
nr:hypothetical protein Itr_chr04CG24300 [Ipomoea trifida]